MRDKNVNDRLDRLWERMNFSTVDEYSTEDLETTMENVVINSSNYPQENAHAAKRQRLQ